MSTGKEIANNIGDLISIGVRSIGANFPVAAGIVNAWNEYQGKLTNQRIAELFSRLEQFIQENENKFTELSGKISGDSFIPQYFELITRQVSMESSEFKREAYSKLLGGTILRQDISAFEKLSYIQSMDTLNEIDLKVLSWLQDERPHKIGESIKRMLGKDDSDKLSNLIAVISKLESRGMVGQTGSGEGVTSQSWVGDSESWFNRWQNKYYTVLPFGIKFWKMIN